MIKLDSTNIDAYNTIINVMKSNKKEYDTIIADHIKMMYKILRADKLTRWECIDTIYESLKNDISITHLKIERITEVIK